MNNTGKMLELESRNVIEKSCLERKKGLSRSRSYVSSRGKEQILSLCRNEQKKWDTGRIMKIERKKWKYCLLAQLLLFLTFYWVQAALHCSGSASHRESCCGWGQHAALLCLHSCTGWAGDVPGAGCIGAEAWFQLESFQFVVNWDYRVWKCFRWHRN